MRLLLVSCIGLSIFSTLLIGAESISVYEDVLRSVRYRLAKGSARFERRFRLSCSEMNGRYTSNELTLEVRGYIIHTDMKRTHTLIIEVQLYYT